MCRIWIRSIEGIFCIWLYTDYSGREVNLSYHHAAVYVTRRLDVIEQVGSITLDRYVTAINGLNKKSLSKPLKTEATEV